MNVASFLLLIVLILTNESLAKTTRSMKGEIDSKGRVTGAKGGTELMREALMIRLPRAFKRSFRISASRVRDETEDGKKHVLWLHDLPEDTESQHLKLKESRDRFSAFVFVSHYQKRRYERYFGIEFPNAVVLKNAIEPFKHKDVEKSRKGPIRLIYHTTPHRGLSILIPVFMELYKKYSDRIHLDVYSSFGIYGWKSRDEPFEVLFEQCRQHPGCTYHGFVSNDKVRDALRESHIFAYPSIWEETSCIAAIEAMSAGCEIVTPNLGALPETLGEYGMKYDFSRDDMSKNAMEFIQMMDVAIRTYWTPEATRRRREMSLYAAREFGWGFPGWPEGRTEQWIRLLSSQMPELGGEKIPQRDEFNSNKEYAESLFVAGKIRELRGEIHRAVLIYERALTFAPRSSILAIALGMTKIFIGDSLNRVDISLSGFELLESVIAPGSSYRPLPRRRGGSIVRYGVAIRGAFWYVSRSRMNSHLLALPWTKHNDEI